MELSLIKNRIKRSFKVEFSSAKKRSVGPVTTHGSVKPVPAV